jgi:BlaI family penicillinase repressor
MCCSLSRKATYVALLGLSRREREIMEILYRLGKGSAADVREAMKDAPGYSGVRAMLRVLEEKGHIKHENEGLKYVYIPMGDPNKAKRSAVKHLVETFFRDAPEQVVAALLDVSSKRLTQRDLDRMAEMIDKVRKGGE